MAVSSLLVNHSPVGTDATARNWRSGNEENAATSSGKQIRIKRKRTLK